MEIIAHRGASHDAPENTLAAARLAWAQGADAVECDVHLTRDGRLAVMHDADAARTTGQCIRISDTTLAELQRLDAGRWKQPRFTGEAIPALEQLLATVPGQGRVFIEIKGGAEMVTALAEALQRSPQVGARQVAVISFELDAVRALKQRHPNYETAWIVDAPGAAAQPARLASLLEQSREARVDGIDFECSWMIGAKEMQHIHRCGFKAYVWTIDDPALARRWQAAGVDGLTTNRPGWLRRKIAAGTGC